MADPVQLVVGLGNPGAAHRDDRHNAGFWFLEELARRRGVELREQARFKALLGRDADGLRLLAPTTWMNLSGEAVVACASYFRIPPQAVLVAHDELDLDAGTARLKRGGGHGGHNGLRSIDRLLGSSDYLRVRLGIGRPGPGADVSRYVLSSPTAAEREAIHGAVDGVIAVVDDILAGRIERAMNTLNRRRQGRDDTQ